MELRGDDDVVPPSVRERLADDGLGLALRVDVRRVDEVDYGVQRVPDDRDRGVVIGLAPGTEHHRPETERADLHSGTSEAAVLHLLTVGAPANPADGPRVATRWWVGRRAVGRSFLEFGPKH